MSWTYTNDPSNVPLDAVRFLVGDTNEEDQLVSDQEVTFCRVKGGSDELSAAYAADAIAASFASQVDVRVGKAREDCSQRMKHYQKLAVELRAQGGTLVSMSFGGLTHSGKQTLDNDTNAVQPSFARGMSDNPGAPTNVFSNEDLDGR